MRVQARGVGVNWWLVPGWQRNKLLHGGLLRLGLAEEDVVPVEDGGLAVEDTVQGLVINEHHLGWIFPVPLMVPPEVDPVSQLDLADVGVGALLQSLPQHSV